MHPWYGPARRDAPVDDRRARVDEPQLRSPGTDRPPPGKRRQLWSGASVQAVHPDRQPTTCRHRRGAPTATRTSCGRADERRELSIGGGVPVAKRRVRTRRRARGETWKPVGGSRSAACPPSHRKAPLTVTGDTQAQGHGGPPAEPKRLRRTLTSTPTSAADASTCANPTITARPSVDSQWSRMMVAPHIGQAGGGALWAGAA